MTTFADESNIIIDTDIYKTTHHLQRPHNLTGMYAYAESRGGMFPETQFSGLQPYIKRLAGVQVTPEKIDEAEELISGSLGNPKIFNRAGWEHMISAHGGRLPLEIRAVPEGTLVPTRNVLTTVEPTCGDCSWLGNYVESKLLKVWYPTTVGTLSYYIRKLLTGFAEHTCDVVNLDFALNDFGYRGASSDESARIGGMAHLINFRGTDNLPALKFVRDYYNTRAVVGNSIPAAEHSTITPWGRTHEADAYRHILDAFPTGMVAVVSDTYDIYNACANIWGGTLRDKVMNRDGVVVIRPDSGHPATVVVKVVKLLAEKFGFSVNSKGFMVLNPHVRVIQGDGINYGSIAEICAALVAERYSIENVAFGMGGALLQQVNRDTQQFAFKASAAAFGGRWEPISKRPVTDPNKASKGGCLALRRLICGDYETRVREHDEVVWDDLLETVFLDGEVTKEYTFEQVRANAYPEVVE